MKILEKSIRREMKFFGPRLRNGHYGVVGYTLGRVPNDFTYIKKVCCNVENGECTDIRFYSFEDAMLACDHYGESIDITKAIHQYLMGSLDWNQMIKFIEDIINDFLLESPEISRERSPEE